MARALAVDHWKRVIGTDKGYGRKPTRTVSDLFADFAVRGGRKDCDLICLSLWSGLTAFRLAVRASVVVSYRVNALTGVPTPHRSGPGGRPVDDGVLPGFDDRLGREPDAARRLSRQGETTPCYSRWMKLAGSLLALLLCSQVSAAETYIVPAFSDGQASLPVWLSFLFVTNPYQEPVAVRIVSVLPFGQAAGCDAVREILIPARKTVRIGADCAGVHLSAIVLEADRPVGVTSEATLLARLRPGVEGEISREAIAIGRRWLQPNIGYVIPDVQVSSAYPGIRSNLFVINPGETALDVRFQRWSDEELPSHGVSVPPRSAMIVPLPEENTVCFTGGDVAGLGCASPLEIRGSGPFYAAVSVITAASNQASFRSPIDVQSSEQQRPPN